MPEYRFRLNISADKLLHYYSGSVRNLVTYDDQGVRIQFPLQVLRPFVRHGGIQGEFLMRVDDNNKFIDIQQLKKGS